MAGFAKMEERGFGMVPGTAAYLDVETTGLSPNLAEIVEVGIAVFDFDWLTGTILGVRFTYSRLRQPSRPIPATATRIHGITNQMVQGCAIDASEVRGVLDGCAFVAAHNAPFDMGFAVRLWPWMARWSWVCSMRQVDWHRHGFQSRRLHVLAQAHGIQPDQRHRALADCLTGVELLSRQSPDRQPYLAELLEHLPKQVARPFG